MKMTKLVGTYQEYVDLTPEAAKHFEQKALNRKKLKNGLTIYYNVKGTSYPCRVTIMEKGSYLRKGENGELMFHKEMVDGKSQFTAIAELVPFYGY